MQNKFETLQYFQHFKACVELVFNTKIQIFWNDYNGDFLALALIEVLNLASMYRELTQAYTPHQNGVS
jgi:hypothetical protein